MCIDIIRRGKDIIDDDKKQGRKQRLWEWAEGFMLANAWVYYASQSFTASVACGPSEGTQIAKCQQEENREIESEPSETHGSNIQMNLIRGQF